jgi:hypothetical protein
VVDCPFTVTVSAVFAFSMMSIAGETRKRDSSPKRTALGHASRVSRADAASAIVVKLDRELSAKLEYND